MIVVIGLNHRTAPIHVRERLALPKDQIPRALEGMVGDGAIGEAMLISTCNRVELVVSGKDGAASDLDSVAEEAVRRVSDLSPEVRQHLYVHRGSDAVRHLFRVASSLDSLVLGEPHILGQVKDAFELARKTGTVGGCLHRRRTVTADLQSDPDARYRVLARRPIDSALQQRQTGTVQRREAKVVPDGPVEPWSQGWRTVFKPAASADHCQGGSRTADVLPDRLQVGCQRAVHAS